MRKKLIVQKLALKPGKALKNRSKLVKIDHYFSINNVSKSIFDQNLFQEFNSIDQKTT